MVIKFSHEGFEEELYAMQRYYNNEGDSLCDAIFSNNETVALAKVVEESTAVFNAC